MNNETKETIKSVNNALQQRSMGYDYAFQIIARECKDALIWFVNEMPMENPIKSKTIVSNNAKITAHEELSGK